MSPDEDGHETPISPDDPIDSDAQSGSPTGATGGPVTETPQSAAPTPPSTANASSDLTESQERTYAMAAHLSGVVAAFVGPLVVLALWGEKSDFVQANAKEALNFQITMVVAWFVTILLFMVGIGCLLAPVVLGYLIIMPIIAGVQANQGNEYRYPFIARPVK